jgi:hypothetical protein
VIDKKNITVEQLEHIRDRYNYAQKMGWDDVYCDPESDYWTVSENGDTIECDTFMDNFDLIEFVGRIGVPIRNVDSEN